jgi:hypothetical protein
MNIGGDHDKRLGGSLDIVKRCRGFREAFVRVWITLSSGDTLMFAEKTRPELKPRLACSEINPLQKIVKIADPHLVCRLILKTIDCGNGSDK